MNDLPPYATRGERLWRTVFLGLCALVFFFLIFPLLVIVPLSFTAGESKSFTAGMLGLEREAYSLRWYHAFFQDDDWRRTLTNSLSISPAAAALATGLGTMAAIGLSRSRLPYRGAIMAVLISPMIVPLIISATGMYFFYSRIGLQGSWAGVVLAHAVLGVPFVVITVSAALSGYDPRLSQAAQSLGAGPLETFFRVEAPLILPGVVAGGLFAFITSFDEVVVVLFVGSEQQKTLPWKMFLGLREDTDPTVLAVATLLVGLSVLLLAAVEWLRRRSERLRGLAPD